MRNKRKFLMVGFVIAFAALVGVASIAAQPATSYGFPSTLRHSGTPTSSSEQVTTGAGAQGGAGSGNVQALASTSFGVAQDGGLGQALPQSPQVALGTGSTYQGQLKKSNVAVNDNNCSMMFSLWDSQSNGTGQVGGNQTINPVVVTNGLFSVLLNGAGQFGASAFNGEARWLQTSVQCAGDGSPVTLSRQPLTAAPYALFSAAPWATSGSTLYYNGGNVGIGTTNPATLLHLNSPNTLLRLESTQNDVWTVTDYKTDTREWHTGVGGSNVPNDVKNKYYIYDATANQVRMVIKTDGSVGIGMTIPFATLDVQGPDTNGGTLAFQVSNSNADFGLQVYDDRSVRIGALNSSTTTHACYANPFIHAFAACSSAAEYVPTMNDGSGFPETADLVSLAPAVTNPYGDTHGPFAVQKAATACDANLLGFIVKPESGADGEKLNDHYLPLAIYGYFPAKVTADNGPIKRGDALTSSAKPGYGMKATQACKIIGYALEDAEQDGTIQVFAHLSENATGEVQSLRTQVQQLKEQNAALEARLNAIEQALGLTAKK